MRRGAQWLIFILAVAMIAGTAACQKKQVSSDAAYGRGSGGAADSSAAGSRRGIGEQDLGGAAGRGAAGSGAMVAPSERAAFENEDIYFNYDSSALTPQAQEILRRKAAFLKANPLVKVTIEGHCDDRGTNEYNLALGEARARSAKSFLVDLGIPAARLATISYGEERPAVKGSGEEVWAKNRRAHFVIEQ